MKRARQEKGRLGNVTGVERVEVEGTPTIRVEVDLGDEELVTAEHLSPSGVDAPPLVGDEVMLQPCEGHGATFCCSYADPKNAGVAEDGEYRTYARDDEGTPVCEVWLKKDGTVAVRNIKSGSKIDLNGVLIDQQGNLTAPGEITAKVGTPDAPQPGVKLSTHLHPTGVGPTSPPTPGS